MHRSFIGTIAGLVLAASCGSDNGGVTSPFTYTLTPTTASISVGQDSLKPILVDVMRSGTDTTIKNVQLLYRSADYSIASVDATGNVIGIRGGSTTVTVSMGGTSVDIPVTVVPHPATSIALTVLTGPAGGLKSVDSDTGTFYALPADPGSSRLKAVVRVGNDTVFCNYCKTTTPARVMRQVIFRSLDTALANVSNFANPLLQTSTDTSGRITATDTTSVGVRFVLEVPADNIADTVLVKFALRPIDSLALRPDSNFFPTTNGTGLQKQVYPNADNVQANVKAAGTTNFVVGLDFVSKVQDPPAAGSATLPAARFIPSRLFGAATFFRKSLPVITWESANTAYLDINAAGAVTGKCASIGGSCSATGSSVLNCSSTGSAMPQLFAGNGTYSIPSCSPAKNITMPGAFCTSSSSTDLSSTCTIWVRATAIDDVTGKTLKSLYRINIGR
jgi:hypothetical protein